MLQVQGVEDEDELDVSIPLKSGRCCKLQFLLLYYLMVSQSLWSQGGAARRTGELIAWLSVSIPLKSGRCCKSEMLVGQPTMASQSLWSQGGAARQGERNVIRFIGLNPFEVREVLQDKWMCLCWHQVVSIPLKSGRCCKGALQNFLIKINKLFVNFR